MIKKITVLRKNEIELDKKRLREREREIEVGGKGMRVMTWRRQERIIMISMIMSCKKRKVN